MSPIGVECQLTDDVGVYAVLTWGEEGSAAVVCITRESYMLKGARLVIDDEDGELTVEVDDSILNNLYVTKMPDTVNLRLKRQS